ncbi:hypothetical protein KL937_003634 [Ogataea polymorpha]|uniref:uncharacterized protein n=1 Tax=Ogataea polymorpha TaxID=460523 RepID=UPI0007F35684|nr:uncharacterized protein OGAPODRAFT_16379 [Ogataea polymorpha]KAG7878392.1 hypothetical protein KL937_003634 [Ogataea polymorpha]KAG7933813.1 hypothetical protein KL904_004073 [Ogataea polymorpha]OBA16927.1 hypothetical protein OGAPODRAFT_16379 [Ogataea polymorpha]
MTTALELAQRGHSVEIVARHLPGDVDIEYTSPFAGANWASFAGKNDIEMQEWDRIGYFKFMDLAENAPGSSVIKRTYQVLNSGLEPWFKDFVQGYRELPADELRHDATHGYEFTTVAISVSIYLHYLLQKLLGLGVKIHRGNLKHIKDAAKYFSDGTPDMTVNCTGLLACRLGGVVDDKVFPIKGQVILSRNSCPTMISVKGFEPKGESLYIFPRKEGGTIIGGCFRVNDWTPDVDEGLFERTVARAKQYCPELFEEGELDVMKVQCGLRPGRKGGARIEKEYIAGVGKVVHNYGAAGAGYQNSHGMAMKTVMLVESFLRDSKL